ncbi:MAG: hypothetical protein FD138_3297 [Planctomycetota bacterium]|nr:MAG: hypothetical protein FD138_3297 [Planctomycetota bacterium]
MAKAKRHTPRKTKAKRGVNYARVQEIARELPGVEDSTSYGTPALKVRGTLLARLKEDGETLVLKTTFTDRELLLGAAPDVFYLTDHYLKYPWILVRLPQIDESFLRELMAEAWQLSAPASLVKEREKG